MGVKDILKQSYIKDATTTIQLSSLKGQVIAADISGFLYDILYGLIPGDNKQARLVQGFYKLATTWKQCNILVPCVFDGKSPATKLKEKQSRDKKRKAQQTVVNDLSTQLEQTRKKLVRLQGQQQGIEVENNDELPTDVILIYQIYVDVSGTIKLELKLSTVLEQAELNEEKLENQLTHKQKQMVHPTQEDVQLVKTLLSAMHFPIVQAEYEADSTIAALNRSGMIQGCFSGDSDGIWLNFNIYKIKISMLRDEKTPVTCYLNEKIRASMKFTQEQIVDYCFLVDTDFKRCGLPMIGHVNAYKNIGEHGSMKNFVQSYLIEAAKIQVTRSTLLEEQQVEISTLVMEHQLTMTTLLTENQVAMTACVLKNQFKNPKLIAKLQARQEKLVATLAEKQKKLIASLSINHQKALILLDLEFKKCHTKHNEALEFYEWFISILPIVMEYNKDNSFAPFDWTHYQDPDNLSNYHKECLTATVYNRPLYMKSI